MLRPPRPISGQRHPRNNRAQQLVQRQAQDAVDQQALAAETGQPHACLGVVLLPVLRAEEEEVPGGRTQAQGVMVDQTGVEPVTS